MDGNVWTLGPDLMERREPAIRSNVNRPQCVQILDYEEHQDEVVGQMITRLLS